MQKQKTIAKWLAVVLLLTVAIACYVALSAILQKSDDTKVAGANDSNPQQQTPVKKTYSTFPRKAENVDKNAINHVGGSDDETLLSTVYYRGKTLVFFKSESDDRDVKESGLYIAVFSNFALEKTVKIGEISETFLDCSLSKNGLVVFISSQNGTRVLSFDESVNVNARCQTKKYSLLKTYLHANSLFAIAYDGVEFSRISVSENLTVSGDNFVCSANDVLDYSITAYCEKVLIFSNSTNGANCLIYEQNKGFSNMFSQNKSKIVQILPVVASERQTFVLLLKKQDGYDVASLDSSLALIKKEYVENSRNAALFSNGNSLSVLTENAFYRFCAHLDFGGKSSLDSVGISKKYTELKAFDGDENTILATSESGVELLVFNGTSFKKIATLPHIENTILSSYTTGENGYISLVFESDSNSKTTYMGFGKKDVFVARILTSNEG